MRALFCLALLSSACDVDGTAPRASATTPAASSVAPDPVRTSADGQPRQIAFAAGERLTVTPLRIVGRKAGVVAECAVRIGGREIVTIGAAGSPTEALICDRLAEIGALPPIGERRRLGLIYNAGSPNTEFRAPVVLVEATDGWAVDEPAFERFDGNNQALTITRMAEVLAKAP